MSRNTTPRELHGKRLFGYSLGDLGFTLPNMFTEVFIFQYYVYSINLNALLVSIGVTAQLILGAIAAIIFGVMIDNKKPGKLGKRRPFLLIGLPVWAITTIMIWFPPLCPQDNSLYFPTAFFFWGVTMIRTIFRALIFNVYTSMLPEQSQTQKNREKIASIRSAFSIIASIIAMLLPIITHSLLSDPSNVKWWEPSGKIMLLYIPFIGLIFTVFGSISVIIIFISVDESFHNRNSSLNYQKTKIRDAFKRMSIPAKDKNFAKLMLAGFFIGVSGKIVALLVFPFQTYLMQFQSSEFFIYILISIFGKFIWFFIWKRILKRNHIVNSYSVCILLAVIASFMDVLFLLNGLQFNIKLILYIITWSTVLGSMYAYPLFSIPIMASLVQETAGNDKLSNVDEAMAKISGSYYGLESFVRSMGPAFASMFVGSILSGPNEENPYVIITLFISLGVFYLIAFVFIKRIKLSKDSYYNKQ
ncbi:MAG: MFS transporter, partial [Candidatus Lokiarchaeota archaeon]|nr:MFS transporter [Candidatus Lokiarchaeota archaeon]